MNRGLGGEKAEVRRKWVPPSAGPLRPYGAPPHQVRGKLPQRGRKGDYAQVSSGRGDLRERASERVGGWEWVLAGGFGVDLG